MPRTSNRERLLDAAQVRLLEHGPQGLVLDAVAADAGVSKGGLLYHFATKSALVEALTERMFDGFDRTQRSLVASDPDRSGRFTRAYLHSTVKPDGEPADDSARLMAALLAGLGGDPERLAAVRERYSAWQRAIENDDLDPAQATLVRLAADGLWLSALLGLPPISPRLATEVVASLEALTGG